MIFIKSWKQHCLTADESPSDETTLVTGVLEETGINQSSDGWVTQHDAWLLWRALCDEARSSIRLQRQLDAVHASKSWRVTAPLRAIQGWLRGTGNAGRPPLQPEPRSAGHAMYEMAEATCWDRTAALTGHVRGNVFQPDAVQLLVDVTELALEDHGGGIQRVVARILSELVFAPPVGFTVVPIRLGAEGRYLEARHFLARFMGMGDDTFGSDRPVAARISDVFIGLDLIRDRADTAAGAIDALRLDGARIIIVVYDLLPIRQPHWFPPGIPTSFARWFDRIAMSADGLACISVAVADECKAAAEERLGRSPPPVTTFPMGADFAAWLPQQRVLPRASSLRLLMVGTLEPRKGHAQALDAFDSAWAGGSEVELVIAGRIGWDVAALHERIIAHPRLGSSLHWVERPSDALLAGLYQGCDFLLMPSSAEGFGLPIIEAGRAGCRLILKDLPVFREVAGENAIYFSGGAEQLTAIIKNCADAGIPTHRNAFATSDWADATDGLLKACGIAATRGMSVSPPK